MSPKPIETVLSTFQSHGVRALLMGGYASIIYGGAEFTHDVDFAVDATEENLGRLRAAFEALRAQRFYVPELTLEVLKRRHGCHFRCAVLATCAWT